MGEGRPRRGFVSILLVERSVGWAPLDRGVASVGTQAHVLFPTRLYGRPTHIYRSGFEARREGGEGGICVGSLMFPAPLLSC